MKKDRFFKFWIGLLILMLFNILAGLVTNVSITLSDEDKLIFQQDYSSFMGVRSGVSPEGEINIIRHIQSTILRRVPSGPGIPDYSDREPADVLRRNTGLCYDRSRLLDKIFIWAGFETRHVYILYKPSIKGYSLPLWMAFLFPRSDSHAVTEVKTANGWLLVDSNDTWISVNRQGEVVTADQVWSRSKEFDAIPDYFGRPYWAIRGLYSRRGHLYRPFFPYPQLNWADFFYYYIQK